MRNTDISCINKDDLEVYTDYKQTNGQKMIPLHYVTDLKKVNNQKKVFFEISRLFCKSDDFFCWLSRFFTSGAGRSLFDKLRQRHSIYALGIATFEFELFRQ